MITDTFDPLYQALVCLAFIFMVCLNPNIMYGQEIHSSLPESIDPDANYVFYLHGMIVQQQGANAVSEQYGPYEYNKIVKALAELNDHVISEVRKKDAQIEGYGQLLADQAKDLINAGVPPENISIVGASLGAYMAVEAAIKLKNQNVKIALLGMCSDYGLDYFAKRNEELCGNFLSIYETSDGPGSCAPLLDDNTCKAGFREISLNMGNGHGFLYKPYPEWMRPLQQWIETK